MTPQQFAQILTDLVARRVLTRPEAAELMQRFLDGEFPPDALPLAPAEAQAPVGVNDAAIFAFLLLALGLSSMPARRLNQRQRDRLRSRLRDGFERDMRGIAETVVGGGSIREAHQQMKGRTTQYTARQYVAGRGLPTPTQLIVGGLMAAEYAYMYRFFNEIALRRLIGRQYSVEALASRSTMYGGKGWAAHWKGNEADADYGWVAVYTVKDTGIRLCGPCAAAGRVKYYLPSEGVYPGQDCLGKGYCRCTRSLEFHPLEYERLRRQGPQPLTLPQPAQRQRQAA